MILALTEVCLIDVLYTLKIRQRRTGNCAPNSLINKINEPPPEKASSLMSFHGGTYRLLLIHLRSETENKKRTEWNERGTWA